MPASAPPQAAESTCCPETHAQPRGEKREAPREEIERGHEQLERPRSRLEELSRKLLQKEATLNEIHELKRLLEGEPA